MSAAWYAMCKQKASERALKFKSQFSDNFALQKMCDFMKA